MATEPNGAVITCEKQASVKETSLSPVVEHAHALSPDSLTPVRQHIQLLASCLIYARALLEYVNLIV